MSQRIAKRILLIGWDAADWNFMQPLIDAGMMPTLRRLIDRGVMGKIATLIPALSPMLWTSIATGKRPEKHGIHGFIEPTPDGKAVQVVSSTSRKTKAIWNILTQAGLKCHVFGWYASHPAEPISGVCVSNRFPRRRGKLDDEPVVAPMSVHPADMADKLRDFLIHPEEIQGDEVAPFIPLIRQMPPHPLYVDALKFFREVLADTASLHNAVTYVMQHDPGWDLLAVYYDAIDLMGHKFMSFHPPRMPNVDEQTFALFKDVMTGCYRYHDMMLQTLIDLSGDQTTVILLSDHGFHSDKLRPVELPDDPVGPVAWHRTHGVLTMAGPGVVSDERVYGATLLDITPTILAMLGLPIGKDMDGKALLSALQPVPEIERIDSWDDLPGDAGLHPQDLRVDPFEASEAIKHLADLGYVDVPTDDQQKQAEIARTEAKYNLAHSLIDAGRVHDAARILEELYQAQPTVDRFVMPMAQCRIAQQRFDEAAALLDSIAEKVRRQARWQLFYTMIELARGNFQKAAEHARTAEATDPENAALLAELGSMHFRRRQWNEARRFYQRAVESDPDAAGAWQGLGGIALHEGKNEEAVEHFLRAVQLAHFSPRAHFSLGVALARLNMPERGAKSLEIALQMRPMMHAARRYLIAVYLHTGQPEKAAFHRSLLMQFRQAYAAQNPDASPAGPTKS